MEIVRRRHPWYTVLPLTAILAFLLTLTGFWQLIFAAGLLAGILMKRPWGSFAIALVGGSLAWGIPLAIASSGSSLAEASSLLLEILGLCAPCFAPLPYIITISVSAIVTALGALLGAYGYAILREERGEIEEMP